MAHSHIQSAGAAISGTSSLWDLLFNYLAQVFLYGVGSVARDQEKNLQAWEIECMQSRFYWSHSIGQNKASPGSKNKEMHVKIDI